MEEKQMKTKKEIKIRTAESLDTVTHTHTHYTFKELLNIFLKNKNSEERGVKKGSSSISRNVFYAEEKCTNQKYEFGITLIALVITILFSYDEKLKYSNNKGFLLATI
jgi:hypothetical protein